VTREVVELAHAKGVTVEGELGTLGGIEDGVGSGEVHLTDPDQAVEFVERTGIDALAVAIGTSHGAYKFDREPDGEVLAMNLIEEINQKLPDTHLVMHGSSSVPRALVESSTATAATSGRRGASRSARSSSASATACARSTSTPTPAWPSPAPSASTWPSTRATSTPRDYLKPARAAMQAMLEERMRDFGQAGHAGDYEPLPLEAMRERYAAERSAV
jgi:fructose-bisphosphate aldolase class II